MKIIRSQVTTRVVNPGDPIPFSPHPRLPDNVFYDYTITPDIYPDAGNIHQGTGVPNLRINEVDLQGRNWGAVFNVMTTGDKISLDAQEGTLVAPPIRGGLAGEWTFLLEVFPDLIDGTYQVHIARGTQP